MGFLPAGKETDVKHFKLSKKHTYEGFFRTDVHSTLCQDHMDLLTLYFVGVFIEIRLMLEYFVLDAIIL